MPALALTGPDPEGEHVSWLGAAAAGFAEETPRAGDGPNDQYPHISPRGTHSSPAQDTAYSAWGLRAPAGSTQGLFVEIQASWCLQIHPPQLRKHFLFQVTVVSVKYYL